MTPRRIYLAVFATTILIAAARLPVAFDEAYYWTWSTRLAAHYFDHPPGIAWFIAASRTLFGDGVLALRIASVSAMLLAVLSSVATVYRLVAGQRRHAAGWLVVLSWLGSLMFVIGYLPATPDVLQGAVLSLAAYATVRAFDDPKWASVAGFVLVAGILIKHSSALVAVGVFVSLLTSSRGRSLAKAPMPWLGVGLALIVVAGWWWADTATTFQLTRVLDGKTRGIAALPLTVGAMLLTLGVPVTAGLFVAVFRAGPPRVLAGGAMAVVAGCVVAAWFSAGEVNWVMPAMAFGLPAAITAVPPRWFGWYERITWGTSLVWLLALVHVVWPFLPIPPAKDRTLRAAGFDEVAHEAARIADEHGAKVIVARRYQIASMMRFHLGDRMPVYELGTSRRSQYDRWPRPRVCAGDTVVLVFPVERVPFEATALAPTTWVTRRHGPRELTRYAVTALSVTADFPSCEDSS